MKRVASPLVHCFYFALTLLFFILFVDDICAEPPPTRPPIPRATVGKLLDNAKTTEEIAEDSRRWDIGVQVGMRAGLVRKLTATPNNFGGFPAAVVLHEPLSRRLTFLAMIQIVVDLANFQSSGQSIDFGLQYI